MGVFSLLSLLQFTVRSPTRVDHRAQLTLMMVLTASTYKMAIAGKLPAIAYLTWLDCYSLWNFGLIMIAAIQSRLLAVELIVPDYNEDTGLYDTITTWILAITWGLVQIWYSRQAYMNFRYPVLRDGNLQKKLRQGTSTDSQPHEGAKPLPQVFKSTRRGNVRLKLRTSTKQQDARSAVNWKELSRGVNESSC